MGRGGEGEQRRTDLVAALATLDVNDLAHINCEGSVVLEGGKRGRKVRHCGHKFETGRSQPLPHPNARPQTAPARATSHALPLRSP